MVVIMIIAMLGLVVTTGPGDCVNVNDKPVHRPEPGGNRK